MYVVLSDSTKFVGDGKLWHTHFAAGTEIPTVGDFDGDGKADIITFTRANPALVWVAPSNATSFGTAAIWHNAFSGGGEYPLPSRIFP